MSKLGINCKWIQGSPWFSYQVPMSDFCMAGLLWGILVTVRFHVLLKMDCTASHQLWVQFNS